MDKLFLVIGAGTGFLAVMLGAFGAHGLKNKLSTDMMEVFQTAVQYQFYHTFALCLVGMLLLHWPATNLLKYSGWSFLAGIILFSGSLYVLSFTGIKILGAITPLGGLFFLVGWFLLAVAVIKTA